MKKILLISTFIFINLLAYADSVTWMTKSNADKLMNRLKSEKYLFFFCDCCDLDVAELIQIQSLFVEKSDVVEDLYAVRVMGTKVMTFESDKNGNFHKPTLFNENFSDFASLNYSMIPKDGKGLPLYHFVEMEEEEKIGTCMEFIYFPHPENNDLFENLKGFQTYKDYAQWHRNYIASYLSRYDFLGEWTVKEVSVDYEAYKAIPENSPTFKFLIEASGNAYMAAGGETKRFSWKLDKGLIVLSLDGETTDILGYMIEDNIMFLRDFKDTFDPDVDTPFTILKLSK